MEEKKDILVPTDPLTVETIKIVGRSRRHLRSLVLSLVLEVVVQAIAPVLLAIYFFGYKANDLFPVIILIGIEVASMIYQREYIQPKIEESYSLLMEDRKDLIDLESRIEEEKKKGR